MDVPGWHAQRRAKKEEELYAQRRSNAPYEDLSPMPGNFVGGFRAPTPTPPIPPPKDPLYTQGQSSVTSTQLTHMTAVERSQMLRVARLDPHLQFMVGPLLRYDTVDEHGVWHGAALIVTADSGSIYDPHPHLTYEWDPTLRISSHTRPAKCSFDLGPHPADPHSIVLPSSPSPASYYASNDNGMTNLSQSVPGQELWVYGGQGGTFTFWRFLIQIPLGDHEMAVKYSINAGQQLEFVVPGRNQNMRWAVHSCNGFSAGVNPDDFRGPGYESGYDPVWCDLLEKHSESPFHVLVGGGDQLYCDSIMREADMQDWIAMKPEEKLNYPMTRAIAFAIDRFLFKHYCQAFRRGAFARANSSIPMINMCAPHALTDPEDLQMSPVFRAIGSRGYFFFLLFQCFVNPELDGTSDGPEQHVNKSFIVGNMGPYVSFPSHSFLAYLGPQCSILLLDCRAERTKEQVCSRQEYQKVFQRLAQLPQSVEHLIVQLGIPIAYPRMVFLETALESKLNPLVAIGKTGSLGLSGFVNKFNSEAELLDDLNDHWTARNHKRERNWFIEQLQRIAQRQRMRITFVSGDVHCAAVGMLKTLKSKKEAEVNPLVDHRYMLNIVTSAIVNTPPPNGVIAMVSSLATKVHKTLHHIETDEAMIPIFDTETNGTPRKQKFIMGRRNWCQVEWDPRTGELIFDIRVEKDKGLGQTVGYAIRVPRPGWTR
ncbi:hypothetical protein L208DRAFT_1272706 [Tricholoma matsutake]|nr:hypothetical protein L208DRAFT_1272706 [Tricholoma matsutake 945]